MAGSGIVLSGNTTTDTITISASVDDLTVNAGEGLTKTGNTIDVNFGSVEVQLLNGSSSGEFLFNSSDTIVSKTLDIYKTIVVGSTNLVANGITDTINFVAGSGIVLSANSATDTITITASVDSSTVGSPNKSFQFNSSDSLAGAESFIFNTSDRSIQLLANKKFYIGFFYN